MAAKRKTRAKLCACQSLARNITTETSVTILAKDTSGSENSIAEYLEAPERLMALEQLPAWSTRVRFAGTSRKTPKRHFVDLSLAVGALGLSTDKLLAGGLKYFSFLFKSSVIRYPRIYAGVNNSEV